MEGVVMNWAAGAAHGQRTMKMRCSGGRITALQSLHLHATESRVSGIACQPDVVDSCEQKQQQSFALLKLCRNLQVRAAGGRCLLPPVLDTCIYSRHYGDLVHQCAVRRRSGIISQLFNGASAV